MQAKVKAFQAAHQLSADVTARYIDLVSEMGEVGKELLKGSGYGAHAFHASDALPMELGDCLFSLLSLCEALQIDAGEALDAALAKYTQRLNTTGTMASYGENERSRP